MPPFFRNVKIFHEIYHATFQDHVVARNRRKKKKIEKKLKNVKKMVILGQSCLVMIIWHEKLISLSGWIKETNNKSWPCPFFFDVSKIRRCD